MTDLSFLDHETSHFIDDNLDFSDFDEDMDVEENEAFSKIVSEQMASIVSKDVPVENTTEQNGSCKNHGECSMTTGIEHHFLFLQRRVA